MTTLIVEKRKILSFSLLRSSYLIWIAPAKSMKLSISSRNNSLKLRLVSFETNNVRKSDKKCPERIISNEKINDTSISPID
jgi:hypothetical protein